jgi:DNA-binding MarR family transcriptional regulator
MPAPAQKATLSSEARALPEVVTRLCRALRTSIRADYPFEFLPMAQVELLLAVSDYEPVRIGQLADVLRLAPNTVSGLVQALVESGLTARTVAPSNRGAAVVTLTPAGRTKLADWEQAHQRPIGSALDQLPLADQATVRAALPPLARLVDHLAMSSR